MKKSRILIGSLLVATVGVVVGSTITVASSYAVDATPTKPVTVTKKVTAITPKQGKTISILPEGSKKYWAMDNLLQNYYDRSDDIARLTIYDESMTWLRYSFNGAEPNKDKLVKIFNKYDVYHPNNHILAWDSSLDDVKNYKVIVSQDSKMETIEREYLVGANDRQVTLVNPYTGVTYYWQVNAIKNDDSVVYSDIFTFSVEQSTRGLFVEGVSNTRDLGGYIGKDNDGNAKRTLQGMLYRGSRLEDITENGSDQFKNNFEVKTDLDLRNVGEGNDNPASVDNYYRYPSPYEISQVAPVTGDNTDYAPYINYYGKGSLVKNLGKAVKECAKIENYPMYFHCSVGRDRTGFLGLIINALCGLSKEDIIKEYNYSLFSTTGGYIPGTTVFYNRVKLMFDFFATFEGNTLAEQVENYLVTKADVTHVECENIRNIMFGNPVIKAKDNEHGYENCSRVIFKQYGKEDIIEMVPNGTTLTAPAILEKGSWYNGEEIWDFDNDIVSEDMVLNFKDSNEHKVVIHFSGIDKLDETIIASKGDVISFSDYIVPGSELEVTDDELNKYIDKYTVGDKDVILTFNYKNGIGPTGEGEKVKVIILSGQSNGAGVGRYQCLERTTSSQKLDEYAKGYDNIKLHGWSHNMRFDGFDSLKVDRYYSSLDGQMRFGAELGLAEGLSNYYKDETIYLVKTAMGSASLDCDFRSPSATTPQYIADPVAGVDPSIQTGTGWLYDQLIRCTRETVDYLLSMGKIPSIEGFVWMQGESDSAIQFDVNVAKQYGETFAALINDFKGNFTQYISEDFVTIDGAINKWSYVPGTSKDTPAWGYCDIVNECKQKYAEENNGVYVDLNDTEDTFYTTMFEPGKGNYNSTSKSYEIDFAHYDATSYIDLGHSFATAFIQHNDPTYKQNELRIGEVNDVTISLSGGAIYAPGFEVKYNGEVVRAQYYSFESGNCNICTINEYGRITPIKVGETDMRISVTYKDQVNVKVVKLTVTE